MDWFRLRVWLLFSGLVWIGLPIGDAHAGEGSRLGTRASETIEVPLTVHVASVHGDAVVAESRVRDAVVRANAELRPFGVVLWIRAIESMPMRGGAKIETSAHRFALAGKADRDGSIHVFYVDRVKLTNPAKGDRRVSGMHWRYRGLKRTIHGREYLAVAHNAPATTLVHEVGHAFGLRHEDDFDNLMCSCSRGRRPAFDERQGKRLRAGARRFVARQR